MKKNKWMRLASVLLVLCLLTTSVISGTFAKYVTTDSASDQARVAKWGIVLDVEGTLFDKAYLAATANTPAGDATTGITVQSANNKDLVVAPGTKNTEGMTFSLKGTAEVSTAVAITLQQSETETAAPKDIFLKSGNYRDWTDASPVAGNDYGKAFNLSADYYPVVFTLVETYGAGTYNIKGTADTLTTGMSSKWSVAESTADKTVTVTGNWADMQKLFAALTTAMSNLAPNYKFDNVFKLTWEWAFENGTSADEKAMYNKADTLLGNLQAATGALADGTEFNFAAVSAASALTNPTFDAISADNYNLNTGFYFVISVTQVD